MSTTVCETCRRNKTRTGCYHCQAPVCSRCNVGGFRQETAKLDLSPFDRVCRACLVTHRRAHGMPLQTVRAVLKFVFDADYDQVAEACPRCAGTREVACKNCAPGRAGGDAVNCVVCGGTAAYPCPECTATHETKKGRA